MLATALLAMALLADAPDLPFAIEVVDAQSGRGVPLIELQTVHGVKFWTDSNGLVAFDEPGLMDQPVFFSVTGHGYEFPKDGFGNRGKALAVRPGGSARLEVTRINVAERLYRITGAGIYRDTVLLGRRAPIQQPLRNAKVLGSDSVMNAVYRGKYRWFWGDTNRPGYPLGNFHVPGATSLPPADGGLDPAVGVDLDYLVGDDGFAAMTAKMPGDGPTWIFGLVAFPDRDGRERMFAGYSKIRGALDVYERGLLEFEDATDRFQKVATFPPDPVLFPQGQAAVRASGGVDYVVFDTPYPLIRVRADPEDLKHPDRYEAFTCLRAGSREDAPRIDRGMDGAIRYGWKRDTPAASPALQAKLLKAGLLKPTEALLSLRNVQNGASVFAHTGSVAWNAFRKRWVLIAVELGGSSLLGEVWFAEADTPLGPWVYARKIATHDDYSFYNPKQHPIFAKDGGRVILFEGTYTRTFSGHAEATPRYDYNQIMYRLDLSDPRLNLPVAIYRGEGVSALRPGPRGARSPAGFFALEQPADHTVPVFAAGRRGLQVGGPPPRGATAPLFHALPADFPDPPATTVPLYEVVGADGVAFAPGTAVAEPAGRRPLCRVWKDPGGPALPSQE